MSPWTTRLFGITCGAAIAIGIALLIDNVLAAVLIGAGAAGWGGMLGTITDNTITMEVRSREEVK